MVVAISCALAALSSAGCYRVPATKASVATVELAGVSAEDRDALADRIATRASQRFLGLLPAGVFYEHETLDRFALRRDLARIERYLRARGFYEAQVRAADVIPDGDKVHVTIEVATGEPVRVEAVRVEGQGSLAPDARAATAEAAGEALAVGSPFTEEGYEASEKAVLRAMTSRGHARAKVTKRAEVDLATHRATVVLTATPGPASRLGKITFVGLDGLPEDAVRRVFGIQEGEPYSSEEIDTSKNALLDLGVFSSVEVEADTAKGEADAPVPLTVRCVPAKLRALLFGGGIQLDQRAAEAHVLVGFQSAPGKGTEFRIYLPHLALEAEADDRAPADLQAYAGTELVLVAEDQEPVRQIVRIWLERRGYRVLEAADGQVGLEVAAAHGRDIQLLVTDVVMPNASGPDLADALRARDPELPVIYISGYPSEVIANRGLLGPGMRLLEKPLSEALLLRAVRESLDGAIKIGARVPPKGS